MKAPKIYYLALAVFSIMTLFLGMAHAADMKQPAIHTIGVHGHGFMGMNMTNATMQQHILTGLETKGVDVSAAKTLLQDGNTAAVSSWLSTYFESHKGDQVNATTRFNRSAGKLFARGKGGNLTLERAAFHGTMAGRGNWSGTMMPPHNSGMVKNATRCNTTAIINGLEQKGVDVSTVRTSIQNGDISAVTTWLKSFFPANLSQQAPRHAAWGHRNTTRPQSQP